MTELGVADARKTDRNPLKRWNLAPELPFIGRQKERPPPQAAS